MATIGRANCAPRSVFGRSARPTAPALFILLNTICSRMIFERGIQLKREVGGRKFATRKSNANGRADRVKQYGKILLQPINYYRFNHSRIPPRAGACLTLMVCVLSPRRNSFREARRDILPRLFIANPFYFDFVDILPRRKRKGKKKLKYQVQSRTSAQSLINTLLTILDFKKIHN